LTLNPIIKQSTTYCRYEAVQHATNEDEPNLGLRADEPKFPEQLMHVCTFFRLGLQNEQES